MLSELEVELPADDKLWMAPNAQTWKTAYDATQSCANEDSCFSLCELFSTFAEDGLQDCSPKLNVMNLRLLLHPLHSLVSNYRQVTASLNARSKRLGCSHARVRSSSFETFEEIHSLMRRWLIAFESLDIQGARSVVAARATLMQYHLICINLLCSFKMLEAFSRGEEPDLVTDFACNIQEDLERRHPELLLHCGQIWRLVRETDTKLRRPWWSAAVYRASLVLWVYSITRRLKLKPTRREPHPSGPPVSLDTQSFLDPTLSLYLLHRLGTPHVTAEDGSVVSMDRPRAVLQIGIEAFGRGRRLWRLTRGLQCKMETLARKWDSLHLALESQEVDSSAFHDLANQRR